MRLIYMIAADVLKGLGWEVEINEKDSYWNLVLTNTTSSEDMPQSHKSCLRGLLRGWLMEFNFEGGRQQVNIYKELHGLDPEDDRYSCLDTCVKRTDGNTPQSELNDREIFVRRKDRFDRYVLTEPVSENITTRLTAVQSSIDHAKVELRLKIAEITKRATQEKLNPLVSQMVQLMSQAFQVGFDTGLECGKYTNYQQED